MLKKASRTGVCWEPSVGPSEPLTRQHRTAPGNRIPASPLNRKNSRRFPNNTCMCPPEVRPGDRPQLQRRRGSGEALLGLLGLLPESPYPQAHHEKAQDRPN